MGLRWSISALASDTRALHPALQRAVLPRVLGTGIRFSFLAVTQRQGVTG